MTKCPEWAIPPRMNPYRHFIGVVVSALEAMQASGELPPALDFSAITAEPPRDPAHGDIATNAAMVLAKAAGKKPRDIAEPLLQRLKANPDVVDGAGGGAGLHQPENHRRLLARAPAASAWRPASAMAIRRSARAARSTSNTSRPIRPARCMSAHARGAVVGDALANLLDKAGFAVTKEYYINDAGAQVDKLGQSTYLRYRRRWARRSARFPKASIPASISRMSAPRSPSATARAGSTSPKPTGCPRCAASPSPP